MPKVNFTFNGVQHTVPSGTSIAAALIALNEISWRQAHSGSRGVFCGIGVCFDCRVTVNGVSDIRACIDLVQDGDVIVGDVNAY